MIVGPTMGTYHNILSLYIFIPTAVLHHVTKRLHRGKWYEVLAPLLWAKTSEPHHRGVCNRNLVRGYEPRHHGRCGSGSRVCCVYLIFDPSVQNIR
jgi:hypothetical protein